MEDYAIIYNPTSAAGKSKVQFDRAIKCLNDLGVKYKLFQSEFAGHTIELATQLAKDGYRVIGAGGDGTCNEVFHGVITSNTGVLCGFIPIGSGNDIPGALGIKPDVERACQIIAEGKTSKSDIGLAKTDSGVERYFIGIGSQGFDALVTQRTNTTEKKLSGTWNYVYQVVKTIFTWRSKEVIITMDNDTYEGYSNCIAVGNGPSYGGGMYICQNARVNDGLFHISIVNMRTLTLLYNFKKMYPALLHPHEKVKEYVSKKVRIEMKNPDDETYLCQVDGEVLGDIPVNYECIQEGYEFIKPDCDEVAEEFKRKYGRYFYDSI